jgi:hypothetical protein
MGDEAIPDLIFIFKDLTKFSRKWFIVSKVLILCSYTEILKSNVNIYGALINKSVSDAYVRELQSQKGKQEVLERTNLPTFLTLFKNVICIKTSVCPKHNLSG